VTSVRVLGLIPARGGSRRLPRKNLARLGGRTLVRRALETALASEAFDAVALSTDDSEILAEANGLDSVALVRRPAELATDRALAHDVVIHALQTLESGGHGPFEAVAVIQCTSPFTAPQDLSGAVEMLERTGATSVVSVARLEPRHHPAKFKRMEEGDRLLPYLADDRLAPSHELPPLWVRNGSIYVTRREAIDAGDLVAEDVLGFRMPPERSHDIDTPTDLALAELLLEREEGAGSS
jgi:CMP-N,N'-diacetyllegionaminic acid synthase